MLFRQDVVARKQAGRFDQAELDRKMNLLEEDYKGYFEKKCVNLDKALKLQCFKIPQNVLLKEDLVWENLSNQAARVKKVNLLTSMEKQREEYKTVLYKKTYLRNYIDKLKQAVVYQEELIQREAMLKEKCGLQDSIETLKFLENQWDSSSKQLDDLRQLKEQVRSCAGAKKRLIPVEHKEVGMMFSTEKRLRLEDKLKEEHRRLNTNN